MPLSFSTFAKKEELWHFLHVAEIGSLLRQLATQSNLDKMRYWAGGCYPERHVLLSKKVRRRLILGAVPNVKKGRLSYQPQSN